jgi:hypothetical protein
VTKHIRRVIMGVLPDQRDSHLVLMLEGLGHDGSTIAALETGLRCPTTEIGSVRVAVAPILAVSFL